MKDFWGPFLFGMSWLVLAILLLLMLRASPSALFAMRSRVARVFAWIVAIVCLLIFIMELPYSLGLCRGGFDDAVKCVVLPEAFVNSISAYTFFSILGGLTLVPGLVFLTALFELVHRWRWRNKERLETFDA